jgi:uncharacterized membrane-anchored protein YitT (DUF2179 family)
MKITLLIVGGIIYALAFAVFLIPHNLVPGGVSGIAIVLHILVKTPVGIMVIVLNIPLFLLAMRVLGISFGIKSLLVIIATNLLIDLFVYTVKVTTPTQNPILAAMYGGVMLGTGLGLIFRGGANTGGTDIIGQVLNKYSNMSVGMWILIVDFVVITLAGISTGSVELALLGYLALFISTKVIDLILGGMDYARAAFVVTDETERVVADIYDKLGRGVTVLGGYSPYTKAGKPMIMCVITKRETEVFKNLVKDIDPKAFVILTDIYEVLGEGFKPRV